MNTRGFRDAPQGLGLPAKAAARAIHDRAATGLLKITQFLRRELFVIENRVVAAKKWPEIAQQMFMRKSLSCVLGVNRPANRHDLHGIVLYHGTGSQADEYARRA